MEATALVGIVLSIGITVCAGVFTVAVLGGVGYFIYRQFKQRETKALDAQSWPGTSGVIIDSHVYMDHGSHNTSMEAAFVAYQYEVGGQTYQGRVVHAGDQFMAVRTAARAHDTVARYPAGAQVTVYYNPSNPSDAALER